MEELMVNKECLIGFQQLSDHNMLVSDALQTLCAGIQCESLSVRQPCERLNCQKRTFNHQSAY